MIQIHYEGGPAGFLQIGRRGSQRVWLTVWWGGVTIALPRDRLLNLRSPASRPLFSERNGIGVKMLAKAFGWRLFVRGRS